MSGVKNGCFKIYFISNRDSLFQSIILVSKSFNYGDIFVGISRYFSSFTFFKVSCTDNDSNGGFPTIKANNIHPNDQQSIFIP